VGSSVFAGVDFAGEAFEGEGFDAGCYSCHFGLGARFAVDDESAGGSVASGFLTASRGFAMEV
jgi:hypothetical protein